MMPSRSLLDLTASAEEFEFHWEKLAFLRSRCGVTLFCPHRDDHILIAQIPRSSDDDGALVPFAKQPGAQHRAVMIVE
jgi:hypothetical protein